MCKVAAHKSAVEKIGSFHQLCSKGLKRTLLNITLKRQNVEIPQESQTVHWHVFSIFYENREVHQSHFALIENHENGATYFAKLQAEKLIFFIEVDQIYHLND